MGYFLLRVIREKIIKDIQQIYQQQSGGGYYQEGTGSTKMRRWIELQDGFNNYSQVIYNGDFQNGKKVGIWSIFYRKMRQNLSSCNIITYTNLLVVVDLIVMEVSLECGLNYKMNLIIILKVDGIFCIGSTMRKNFNRCYILFSLNMLLVVEDQMTRNVIGLRQGDGFNLIKNLGIILSQLNMENIKMIRNLVIGILFIERMIKILLCKSFIFYYLLIFRLNFKISLTQIQLQIFRLFNILYNSNNKFNLSNITNLKFRRKKLRIFKLKFIQNLSQKSIFQRIYRQF
ncbi:unnamed protein product [Paramecium sonneborni]|uniref:Transmembrane protein n=1 Tax=Paramecium sonneborni TaxID=65129 RepID=A0A8S1RCV5_9CILI|nr:unnamed protein product [Paramecium sonneborni]